VTIARHAAALAAMALAALPAVAREEPLWEAGLGIAGLHLPDYRGSGESRDYALPTPYFIYRGEVLKADRHGLRGTFFKSADIDLNLSVGASLPVSSDRDRAREGMPDLKPSLEIGPSLDLTLWRAPDRAMKLDLRIPVRAAFTVESHPRFAGTQAFPHANLDVRDPFGFSGWNLGLLAGPVFTDGRYNRRFYEVAAEFATADRPAYDAPGGGYGGVQLIAALSKRFPGFWVGGFVRYDTLRDAVFESSPLVTSKRYVAGGFGFAWILGESRQRVTVNEYEERR
jgi:outer membrane protein